MINLKAQISGDKEALCLGVQYIRWYSLRKFIRLEKVLFTFKGALMAFDQNNHLLESRNKLFLCIRSYIFFLHMCNVYVICRIRFFSGLLR